MDTKKLEQILNSNILDYLLNNPVEYTMGEIVYLKTDNDQKSRIVTAVCLDPNGIQYRVCSGTDNYWAFSNEISKEKNLVFKTTND